MIRRHLRPLIVLAVVAMFAGFGMAATVPDREYTSPIVRLLPNTSTAQAYLYLSYVCAEQSLRGQRSTCGSNGDQDVGPLFLRYAYGKEADGTVHIWFKYAGYNLCGWAKRKSASDIDDGANYFSTAATWCESHRDTMGRY
jgi:hypothetical protein